MSIVASIAMAGGILIAVSVFVTLFLRLCEYLEYRPRLTGCLAVLMLLGTLAYAIWRITNP